MMALDWREAVSLDLPIRGKIIDTNGQRIAYEYLAEIDGALCPIRIDSAEHTIACMALDSRIGSFVNPERAAVPARVVFCDVTIPGPPQAKARAVPVVNKRLLYAWARSGCKGRPPAPRMVTSPRTAQWETMAAWHCCRACPGRPEHTGPIGAEITAVLQRPQRLTKPPERVPAPVAPDADNVAKIALDAAVKAGVIEDDRRITELFVRTDYAAIGEAPHLRMILYLCGAAPDQS